MKQLLLAAAVFLPLSIYTPQNNTAEVEQVQGLYVFVDAKPVKEYTYLGSVKVSVTWTGQYQGVKDALIKKAKKEYPAADGLIFHFNAGGADHADAIKFD